MSDFEREMDEYVGWNGWVNGRFFQQCRRTHLMQIATERMEQIERDTLEQMRREMPPYIEPPLPRENLTLDHIADELAAVKSADDASLAEISRRFAAREDRELEGLLGHAFGGER